MYSYGWADGEERNGWSDTNFSGFLTAFARLHDLRMSCSHITQPTIRGKQFVPEYAQGPHLSLRQQPARIVLPQGHSFADYHSLREILGFRKGNGHDKKPYRVTDYPVSLELQMSFSEEFAVAFIDQGVWEEHYQTAGYESFVVQVTNQNEICGRWGHRGWAVTAMIDRVHGNLNARGTWRNVYRC
ncbi:unnamed protein product [Mycena citricolor]|uniref:Uncharacterized protein n=1 Tax=Mycena citricolor TaxID=2018698 RepID=A0AAD2Q4K9_9AGAR|nr:unnamed protein product [Mycena citricolor]